MINNTDKHRNFFEDVYEVVNLVPYGRVTTYGAIAKYLGTTGSSRMVGWAMNSSHAKGVLAHRVVNRAGLLTGKQYFGNTDQMANLLEAEGIIVKNDKIQNFKNLFWDPMIEQGL